MAVAGCPNARRAATRGSASRRPTPRSSTLLSDMTGVDPRESAVTSEVELLDPGHQLREVDEARSSTVGVVGTLPPPGRKRRSRPGWLAVLGSWRRPAFAIAPPACEEAMN